MPSHDQPLNMLEEQVGMVNTHFQMIIRKENIPKIFPSGGQLWKFLMYLELSNLWTKSNGVTNSIPPQSLIICLQDLAIQNLQFCFIWALTTTGRWWRFNPIKRKIQENNFLSFSFFHSKKKPSVNVPLNNKWIKGTNIWWKRAAHKKLALLTVS